MQMIDLTTGEEKEDTKGKQHLLQLVRADMHT